MHAIGGEEREAMMPCEIDERAVGAFLAPHEMALQLHINAIRAEDLE